MTQRTGELQRSLTELRATQAQLIQREKMASLGELTAGIAHEIQNPLNFVNNFSEVSVELVRELEVALAAGDAAEVTVLWRRTCARTWPKSRCTGATRRAPSGGCSSIAAAVPASASPAT